MANIKEIQDRIKSVQDTMKITNAMYMISSNKLRKAKKALEQTEPFFFGLQSLISRVVRHLPPETKHIFLETFEDIPFEKRRKAYMVITDDKGLAGAYNHNVLKLAEKHMKEDGDNYKLYVVGELGRQYFTNKGISIDEEFRYTAQNPTLSRARHITGKILDDYFSGDVQEVYIIYTRVKNSIVSETLIQKLLPLEIIAQAKDASNNKVTGVGVYNEEFLMEPSPEAVLDNIVPNYIDGFIYGALVESYCAVQNSRMMAMDTANKSAGSMIHDLSIMYNRERQARITQEITEVVSGAKALKHSQEVLKKMQSQTEEALQ
ncbi:MAG: ATP synthase F1 subunit gamma [Butyrivibrio sp.]|nr:ATP synthase F1 subunit gamma [Butyrivibrio sp.]